MSERIDYYVVVNPDTSLGRATMGGDIQPIRNAVGGIFTFVVAYDLGAYIHDEGLYEALALNVPASMLFENAIYGPAVFCDAEPDEDGNSRAVTEDQLKVIVGITLKWRRVIEAAVRAGQDVTVRANPDTVTAPTITPLTDEMMRRIFGEEI